MTCPEKIIETIRKNVKSEGDAEYKKWDGLPMDVRRLLTQAAECLEMQEKTISGFSRQASGFEKEICKLEKMRAEECERAEALRAKLDECLTELDAAKAENATLKTENKTFRFCISAFCTGKA